MKKLGIAALTIAVVSVGVASRGQGKTDPTLDKLRAELVAAFNAKDAAKVAAFYADDALLMPPNEAMVKGRENIEAHLRREFELMTTAIQLRPLESVIAGTVAFEAGMSTVAMKRSGSPTVTATGGGGTASGKYVVILKRVGADWKIAYDIYNVDHATAPEKK
jgi:uncharacterized protein (TIGR02246 family)